MTDDARQYWPATARNRDPILAVLRRVLPDSGRVLEIAAGSGEHAAYFAPRFPNLIWHPTDFDPVNLESVSAWVAHVQADNLREPMVLDVTSEPWPVEDAAAIYNANMIHIAPWSVTEGLMAGAGSLLQPGAPLVMYGPFQRDGKHTSESNAAFDIRLKGKDPSWGVRDLTDVTAAAVRNGLTREEIVEMPANNLMVIFRKT